MVLRSLLRFGFCALLAIACVLPARAGQDAVQVAQAPTNANERVLHIQVLLMELGYDPGVPDGLYGANTRRAIIQYEIDQGLPVDGRATDEVLVQLQQSYRDSKKVQPAPPPEPATSQPPTNVVTSPSLPVEEDPESLPWLKEKQREPVVLLPPAENQPAQGSSTQQAGAGTSLKTPEPAPFRLSGQAKVLDTASLVVAGESIRLNGLRAERRSGLVSQMQAYIDSQGGALRCHREGNGYRCLTGGGYDLGEAVLYNGGAEASEDAPASYLQAEGYARKNRLGRWR